MAKEMEVTCNFVRKQLVCRQPNQIMDMLLKVHMKTGEHTFREDVYTCSLKYGRWNNQLRHFRLLKKGVANIFWKGTSNSDDSRGTSTQSIINFMEGDNDERFVINDNKRNSVQSDWFDLIPIDVKAEYQRIQRPDIRLHKSTVSSAAVAKTVSILPSSPVNIHKTFKNIVLVLYTPKPNTWGSWWVKGFQLTSSTTASPDLVYSGEEEQEQEQEQ